MIGRLQGKIIEKTPPEIVLDVQGVGYELLLPMTSFYDLPKVGEEVTLFTHLSIREDAHLLFGFSQKVDRTLFRALIKTNGVGPKLALAILSAMSVNDFATAVENEDIIKLTKIPGVGKKTAERLLVELKDKFKSMAQTEFFVEQSSLQTTTINTANPSNEAKEALIALGYKATEIEKMLKRVQQQDLTSEQIIREALKKSL
ncbi:Holliday junction branch migration protein RuvA [Phocoenobacter skyensis]|uniref:Holliday junction branch migration complex subunit RuvA n=1 Tax=Phocoenobacter skyensis TaxID=97481 RepID=A0A1H7VWI5_9PAST|nr:Holliday junction branch migration protein RuvA [Pasteurella skyensis]MDP8079031.1 Holliday junction branch migration protein RuvA [Pasteurella skyensis]MDP8084981.1 Holliday junction branch migration protein RuvA [Pasteurella skyensis]MDP8161890.1 Holliday junction branch migration protein RuvA [Pasteurella skyensis]MDP8170365.1 Holliday junction branch migration protein RuvA [Pasteurella skyensis]MDP8172046.1 Holliday junction branch migration protein RuvA [Pasteurella skyensis]